MEVLLCRSGFFCWTVGSARRQQCSRLSPILPLSSLILSKLFGHNFSGMFWHVMDRSEIADIFCKAISSGNVPALFEDFVSEQTTWAVVSGTDPSNSERHFLGILGLGRLVDFCHERLKVAAGEMTGCVIKGDCLFAFGKLRVGSAVEEFSSETSFVVKLLWHDMQIVSAQLRIMWPLPPTNVDSC
jgi:hypothetical protein